MLLSAPVSELMTQGWRNDIVSMLRLGQDSAARWGKHLLEDGHFSNLFVLRGQERKQPDLGVLTSDLRAPSQPKPTLSLCVTTPLPKGKASPEG